MTPIAAEEGLSATLTPQPSISCYGSNIDFTFDELEALDSEGRAILTEHSLADGKSVVIINVYCPRADKENKERVDYKLKFYKLLQERAESLVNTGRYINCIENCGSYVHVVYPCLSVTFSVCSMKKLGFL